MILARSQFESEGGLPTFDGIPFRVHVGRYPSLNTFVIVVDVKDRMGRIVVGSEMNLRAHPGDLQRSEAYNMPRRDIRLSDQSPDVYDLLRFFHQSCFQFFAVHCVTLTHSLCPYLQFTPFVNFIELHPLDKKRLGHLMRIPVLVPTIPLQENPPKRVD